MKPIAGLHTYVYELIDPWTHKVFYVGRGSAGRVRTSGTISQSLEQPKKYARIKEIRDAGLKPIVRTVSSHTSREEAMNMEVRHYDILVHQGAELTNSIRPTPWMKKDRSRCCAYEIINPLTNSVFHVGCNYESQVKTGAVVNLVRGDKAELMTAIRAAGYEPPIRIVDSFGSWIEASRARGEHRERLLKAGVLQPLGTIKKASLTIIRKPLPKNLPPEARKLSAKDLKTLIESRAELARAGADKIQRRREATQKRLETNQREKEVPTLMKWCGEASEYLVPCPDLPKFCVPSWRGPHSRHYGYLQTSPNPYM